MRRLFLILSCICMKGMYSENGQLHNQLVSGSGQLVSAKQDVKSSNASSTRTHLSGLNHNSNANAVLSATSVTTVEKATMINNKVREDIDPALVQGMPIFTQRLFTQRLIAGNIADSVDSIDSKSSITSSTVRGSGSVNVADCMQGLSDTSSSIDQDNYDELLCSKLLNIVDDFNKAESFVSNHLQVSKEKIFKHILHVLAPRFLPCYISEMNKMEVLENSDAEDQRIRAKDLMIMYVKDKAEYNKLKESLSNDEFVRLSIEAFELALDNPELYLSLASDLFLMNTHSIAYIIQAFANKFKNTIKLISYTQEILVFEYLINTYATSPDHEIFDIFDKLSYLNISRVLGQIRCALSVFSGENISLPNELFDIQKGIFSEDQKSRDFHIKNLMQKMLDHEVDSYSYLSDEISLSLGILNISHTNRIRVFMSDLKKIEDGGNANDDDSCENDNNAYEHNVDKIHEGLMIDKATGKIIIREINEQQMTDYALDCDKDKNLNLTRLMESALMTYQFTDIQKITIRSAIRKLMNDMPGIKT